ncbi:hypothetical protein H0E87_012743 [Populus deltoides]|uniref:Uncharacterized protein n=1 Tax=Populus deltoides TaxID=3696 RepID=A0A8T2YKK5_POPDE|nr:hypothetical protein H0E87_012743 [Populus deltoides]
MHPILIRVRARSCLTPSWVITRPRPTPYWVRNASVPNSMLGYGVSALNPMLGQGCVHAQLYIGLWRSISKPIKNGYPFTLGEQCLLLCLLVKIMKHKPCVLAFEYFFRVSQTLVFGSIGIFATNSFASAIFPDL